MHGKWFDRLILVILENHGWSQVQDCQFVQWFRSNGITFTDWRGQTHPSGPNYRTLLSGLPWSGNEFDGIKRPNIGDHVPVCTVNFRGVPANRHDPFLDMKATNIVFNPKDAAIVYLGMDDRNDAHSGSLATADENTVAAITDFQSGRFGPTDRALLVVTFDEAFGLEYFDNHVFMGMHMRALTLGTGAAIGIYGKVDKLFTHQDFALRLYENWNISHPIFDQNKKLGRAWWE